MVGGTIMNILKVENDTITNIIVADSVQWAVDNFGGEWIEFLEGTGIGWTRSGDVWSPPVAPTLEPISRTRLTRLEFRNRFAPSEKEAIYTAAESVISVRIWLDDLAAAEYIELTDSNTIASVEGLAAAGLIAPERIAEILAPVRAKEL
jgi:hypothetical protein